MIQVNKRRVKEMTGVREGGEKGERREVGMCHTSNSLDVQNMPHTCM